MTNPEFHKLAHPPPDASTRASLAQRVADRRKQLGDNGALDPRVRALSQSSAGNLLPSRSRAAHSPVWLALFAVLGVLALIACAGTATAVVYGSAWLQRTLGDPSTTVQSFYGAIQQGDYARAYADFSDSARARMSESAFTAQFSSYDAIDGSVVAYTVGPPRYAGKGNDATIAVAVTRRANPRAAESHTLVLVKQSGQWRITTITIVAGEPTPAPN